jgi:hypothetical protein
MNTFQKLMASIAFSTLVVAQPLSAAPVARTPSHTQASENLGRHPGNALIIVLIFGALLGLFAAAGLFGSGDLPHSP